MTYVEQLAEMDPVFSAALTKHTKKLAEKKPDAKPDTKPTPELETEPLKVKTFDDRCHKAYDLSLAGQSQKEIASEFGVNVSTIKRWIKRYFDLFADEIEHAKKLHLVSKRALEYASLARQSLRDAENAKTDKDRGMFRRLALKAFAQQDSLLALVGAYPQTPFEMYHNIQKMEPVDLSKERRGDQRTKEEIAENIVKIIARTRTL